MALKIVLSQGWKNAVDTLLGFLGLVGGYLTSNAATFHAPFTYFASIAGLAIGYFASDATTIASGGTVAATTVIQQGAATYAQAKPIIQAQIAKLSPADQAIANAALTLLETKLPAV